MRIRSRLAVAALVTSATAALMLPSAQAASGGGGTVVSALSTQEYCHGLTLVPTDGYFLVTSSKWTTYPTVTYKIVTPSWVVNPAPDLRLTMTGSYTSNIRYNGYSYSGRYAKDVTFTTPDGKVWGTWNGSTNIISSRGLPAGYIAGTCNDPLPAAG